MYIFKKLFDNNFFEIFACDDNFEKNVFFLLGTAGARAHNLDETGEE